MIPNSTQLLSNWQGIIPRMKEFSPLVLAGESHIAQVLPILREHGLNPDFALKTKRKADGQFCELPCISPHSLNEVSSSAGICVASLGGVELAKELSQYSDSPILDLFLPLGHEQFAQHFDPRIISENQDAIRASRKLFSDKQSRDLFDKIIAFRLTCDLRFLPISDIPIYHCPATAPRKGDVVIDAGAYDGDTALDFATTTNHRLKIYSFEPDKKNLIALQKKLMFYGIDNIVEVIPKALWGKNERVSFSGSSSSARIETKGDRTVPAITLDSFCTSRKIKPTLFKTDLEGADIEALRGGEKTISTHRPRLAISVYHRPEDLWEIPLLADKLRPDSEFHLIRHTGPESLAEIVCYVA